MTTETDNRYVLKFNTNLGRVIRMSIPRALQKSAVEVEAAMTALIQNGSVYFTGGGTPTSIREAKYVSTEYKELV